MKQWLTILAMIWAAATIQVAGERTFAPQQIEIRTSVLSPQENPVDDSDRVPLLATTSPSTQQFCGTEQPTGKGSRHTENLTDIAHTNHFAFYLRAILPATTGHNACPPSTRTGERYIYFLRSIII